MAVQQCNADAHVPNVAAFGLAELQQGLASDIDTTTSVRISWQSPHRNSRGLIEFPSPAESCGCRNILHMTDEIIDDETRSVRRLMYAYGVCKMGVIIAISETH